MNYVKVEWLGKTLRVPAVKHQGRLWFHWQGETHAVDISVSRRAGGSTSKTQAGVLSAPMPGKVTQVRVATGDSVTKGQALVVMEAMKMEYTLEADRDGKITELNAKAGVQVALGDVLVRVGEA
jgi:acetyl/propionyl-CoA carboxylase alpha subunit